MSAKTNDHNFISTKQTIATAKASAIVGATGNIGSGIAKSLSKNDNYRLLLKNHSGINIICDDNS